MSYVQKFRSDCNYVFSFWTLTENLHTVTFIWSRLGKHYDTGGSYSDQLRTQCETTNETIRRWLTLQVSLIIVIPIIIIFIYYLKLTSIFIENAKAFDTVFGKP